MNINLNIQKERELVEISENEDLTKECSQKIFNSIKAGINHYLKQPDHCLPYLQMRNGKAVQIYHSPGSCCSGTEDPLVFRFFLGYLDNMVSRHFENYHKQARKYRNLSEELYLNVNTNFLKLIVDRHLSDLLVNSTKETELKFRFRIRNGGEKCEVPGAFHEGESLRICSLDVIFWSKVKQIPSSESWYACLTSPFLTHEIEPFQPLDNTVEIETEWRKVRDFTLNLNSLYNSNSTYCSGFYSTPSAPLYHFNTWQNERYRWEQNFVSIHYES